MENTNFALSENTADEVVKKKKFPIGKIIGCIVGIFLLLSVVLIILDAAGVLPEKDYAKKYAVDILENYDDYHDITIEDIEFTSCEFKWFKGKAEDELGYFEYAENTPIQSDGVDYDSDIEYFEKKYNTDIYKFSHQAYTVKGTCTVTDENGNKTEKYFTIKIVKVCGGINHWTCVNSDTMFSDGRNIEENAVNDITAYATITYKDVKTCRVDITDTVKDGSETEVYGKVYITDRYGDDYVGNFKVTYEYDSRSLSYEKTDIEIDTPIKKD